MNAAVCVWDVEQQIQMRFSPNLTCSWSFDKTSVCRETLFFTSRVWFLVHLFFKSACLLLYSFLIILSADYSVSDIEQYWRRVLKSKYVPLKYIQSSVTGGLREDLTDELACFLIALCGF